MSETVVEGTAEQAADRAMALLREYAEKLDRLVERILALAAKPSDQREKEESRMLRERVRKLKPAMLGLSRHASQLIQFGKVSETRKIELRLRVAEIEELISGADRIAGTLA